MRPPDENQHGSTRPNLLSGARRHVGGDDNILERLERDSARHASGNRSRAAWYAAAASLVLLMIVVLAWTAFDNASTVRVIPMTRVPAGNGGAALVTVDPPETPPAPVPAPAPVATVPPLVLLPSHEAASSAPPVSAKSAELAPTAAPVKPAARTAPTVAPAPAVARPDVRLAVAARPRKPGAGVLPTDAAVDTDVALLSAIIIHDSTHAEEKAQLEAAAACSRASGKKCPGRLVN